MMPEQCQSLAANGKPCGAKVVDGTHCAWHSIAPEWVEKRRQWSIKGGHNRSNAARAKKELPSEPLSNAEVHAYMSLAFKRTLAGKMEPGILNALSQAGRTIAELSKAVDLEHQLDEMRREIIDLVERRTAS